MLNCFPWLHVFGVFFLSNHISLSSLLFFLCLFHQMTHVLFVFRPLPPDPPAFSGFLLRFPLPYITCRKSKHGKNEGVLVEWLTSNSSPREGIFFFSLFFHMPLVLLRRCKSTRLTECSKSSGSKKSTLLFGVMGVGLDPEGWLVSGRITPLFSSLSPQLSVSLFPLVIPLYCCRPSQCS